MVGWIISRKPMSLKVGKRSLDWLRQDDPWRHLKNEG